MIKGPCWLGNVEIFMLYLLFGLGNQNLKLELLMSFTSQNKSENLNWNCGSHIKLGMENGRLILGGLGISLSFLGPSKF